MHPKALLTFAAMLLCVGMIVGQSTPNPVIANSGPFVSLPDDVASEAPEVIAEVETVCDEDQETTETLGADESPVVVKPPADEEIETFEAPTEEPIYEPEPIYVAPVNNGSTGGGGVRYYQPTVSYSPVSYGSTGSSVRRVTRYTARPAPSWTGTPIVVRRVAPVRVVRPVRSAVAPVVAEVANTVATFPAAPVSTERTVARTRTGILGRVPPRVQCENGQCRIIQ